MTRKFGIILTRTRIKKILEAPDYYLRLFAAIVGDIDLLLLTFNRDYKQSYINIISQYPHEYFDNIVDNMDYLDIVLVNLIPFETEQSLIMTYAAYSGSIEIVKLMIRCGANNYNLSMKFSAIHCNTEIVKLMLKYGANNYNEVIEIAEINGNFDMVNFLKFIKNKGGLVNSIAKNKHIPEEMWRLIGDY